MHFLYALLFAQNFILVKSGCYRLAVGGRGEVRGRVGWPGRKWRSGPSPDEQESLRFNQINFKLV
jgi:hypothetical protein